METTVDKLEAMFVKSEADLEYIEKRLKLDFINNASENGYAEENPVVMLEKIKALRAKHSALCSQVKKIEAAKKESMSSIRSDLTSVIDLLNHFQKTTDAEIEPLAESEQESLAALSSALCHTTSEDHKPSVLVKKDE